MDSESLQTLINYDKQHIWHPYTSATHPIPAYPITSAKGVRLELMDGTQLIDGMSSWWAGIHGYNHPVLNQAMKAQIDQVSHVMFGGLTHLPAVALAQRLVEITPEGLEHVFYSDSGSVAVEVSMKMACQYWYAKGKEGKNKFATIKSGYHGDTWNAMSVCDPDTGMHQIWQGVLPQQHFVPRPQSRFGADWDPEDIEPVKALFETYHEEIAAFILEPIVQGAGGIYFYHPQYLKMLRQLCDQYEILLIADEIATGFGRSGELFACQHAQISPDMLCLGKAITGGYMSFAATLATAEVAKGISQGDPGVFMHGPTFMGNPLACAVAVASIDLLLSTDWKGNIQRIEKGIKEGLTPANKLDIVKDIRALGAIGAIELKQAVDLSSIQKKFVAHGIWVRPFGRLVYIMPPYIISDEDLKTLTAGVISVIQEEFIQEHERDSIPS